MTEEQNQPEINPKTNKIAVTPQLMALLQSNLGILLRKQIACSVSLQSMAASFVRGVISERDWKILIELGVRTSQETHTGLNEVLDDLQFVGRELIAMHNDTTQAFLNQTVEDALKSLPVVIPDNRMAFPEAARGSVTVILDAPVYDGTDEAKVHPRINSAASQFIDNLPEGAKWYRHDGSLGGDKVMSTIAEGVKNENADLLIIADLDLMFKNDVSDRGVPVRSRVNEVMLKLSRIIGENNLAAVFFAYDLEDAARSVLEEVGARVIKWNDTFGPEAFYGKEEATARREEQIKMVTARKEELKQAQIKAEADANRLPEEHSSNVPVENTKGKIILV